MGSVHSNLGNYKLHPRLDPDQNPSVENKSKSGDSNQTYFHLSQKLKPEKKNYYYHILNSKIKWSKIARENNIFQTKSSCYVKVK